jgi:hypothetical protein
MTMLFRFVKRTDTVGEVSRLFFYSARGRTVAIYLLKNKSP